ncbi:RNAse Z [Ligilactobacillus sp. WC1T17]|uniref:Ribonuclease Z n=1 Tax=Ligilactobacillus ruminis TaxID=1623 RepID=A0ABY1A9L0_9LACO|nr:RNAse Z [Ligilactobacillus ruminis]
MEIEFLGTGAGSPSKFRNVSSLVLKLLDENNSVWMFDCGEGTQHQILRTNIRPRKVDKVFITHLHGDHLFGLPGFLSSRSFQSGEENRALTVYGPKGVADFVKASLKASQTKLSYPLHFVELTKEGLVFEDNKFKVTCRFLDHKIQCFGYRIEEKDHQGELLIAKLRQEQVPEGPLYGQLKAGKQVTLPDGRVLDGKDYLGAPQPGRTIAILGDTRQTPSILDLAKNADVLVHECTFGKKDARLARNYYHSTCIQAAKVAQKAQVKKLLLNHISARYIGPSLHQLEKDARAVFDNCRIVKDFDTYEIPFKKGDSND